MNNFKPVFQARIIWLLSIFFITFQSSSQSSPAINAPMNASTLAHTTKDIINTFFNLDYATTRDMSIAIPQTEQELYINFNGAGSEDLFAPMPTGEIKIRLASKDAVSTTAGFSIAQLGKLLLQDELTAQAKSLSLVQWLNDASLSPIKIFVLKLFLLVKDTRYYKNPDYVIKELVRLMIKLSLVDNLDILDPSKKLSSYFPDVIKEFIAQQTPDVLDIMDAFWSALVSKNSSDATIIESKKVYGFAFKNKALADACYNQFHHCFKNPAHEIPSFAQARGGAMIPFADFAKITANSQKQTINFPVTDPIQKLVATTSIIPAQLQEEVDQVTNWNTLVRATDNNNNHWIGYATNQHTFNESVKLIGMTLINTFKTYIAAREQYFKQHPTEKLKRQTVGKELVKKTKKIEAFLGSALGQASKERLGKCIEQINAIKPVTQDAPANTNEADLKNLNDLKTLATTLKNQGDDVSQEIQTMIDNLEHKLDKNLVVKNQENIDHLALSAKRELLAQAHLQEATFIKKQLDHQYAKIQKTIWANSTEQKIKELEFMTLIQTPAQAYIQDLIAHASALRSKQDEPINGIVSYLGINTELAELVDDLTTNETYSTIKEQLVSNLVTIIKKSDHIKNKAGTIRYLITQFVPELLPLFNQAMLAA